MAQSTPEISLRHLPDLSDASFQIPIGLTTGSDDFLLSNDDDDFLKDADDSLNTPLLLRTIHPPFSSSELTPKPKLQIPQPPPADTVKKAAPIPPVIAEQRASSNSIKTDSRPTLKIITQPKPFRPDSPVAERLQMLKAEVQTLVTPSEDQRATSKVADEPRPIPHKPRDREKQTRKKIVLDGGISKHSKSKSKIPASGLERASQKPVPHPSRSTVAGVPHAITKLSISASIITAEPRIHSQDSVVESDNSSNRNTPSTLSHFHSAELSTMSASSNPRTHHPQDPLRLSELSPRKQANAPASPHEITIRDAVSRHTGTQPAAPEAITNMGQSIPLLNDRKSNKADHTRNLTVGSLQPTNKTAPFSNAKPSSAAVRKPPQGRANQATKLRTGSGISQTVVTKNGEAELHKKINFGAKDNTSEEPLDDQVNITIGDGVAARLMLYSQQLIPSNDPGATEKDNISRSYEHSESTLSGAAAAASDSHSPTPPADSPSIGSASIPTAPPISPMRSSAKRYSSALEGNERIFSRKARKLIPTASSLTSSLNRSRPEVEPKRDPPLRPSLQKNSTTASTPSTSSNAVSRSGDTHSKPGVISSDTHGGEADPDHRTILPEGVQETGNGDRKRTRDATGERVPTLTSRIAPVVTWSIGSVGSSASVATSSRNAAGSRRTGTVNVLKRSGTGKRRPVQKDGQKPEAAALAPANPTKPIGFNFKLDARIEARKGDTDVEKENRRRAKAHNPLPVPDFKALHVVQEAALAARKEGITPVVPAGVHTMNTEIRAREREKFDESVRAKEAEMERLREERRRLEQEETEREIRELRKKAIPKAHEVPEWYAEAPKREGGKNSLRRE